MSRRNKENIVDVPQDVPLIYERDMSGSTISLHHASSVAVYMTCDHLNMLPCL